MITATEELKREEPMESGLPVVVESEPPLCWYCEKPVIGGIVTRYQIPRKDGGGFDHKYTHPVGCTMRFFDNFSGFITDRDETGEACRYIDVMACKLRIQ